MPLLQSKTKPEDEAAATDPAQQNRDTSKDTAKKPIDQQKTSSPRRSSPGGDPSPLQLILLTIGIFLFAQLVIGVVIALYAVVSGQGEAAFDTITESNLNNFLIIATLAIVQFAGVYFVLRRYGKPLKSIGLVRPKLADLPRSIVAWGIYMVFTVVAVGIFQLLDIGIDFEQEQVIDLAPVVDTAGRVFVFASLVLIPAFIEEVLMRGFLFMWLRKKLSFVHSTAIVSVIFGAAHLQFGTGEPLLWAAFIDTLVLSIVLCGLTERYKSIWPAIFVHGIKNGIAFVYLFVL